MREILEGEAFSSKKGPLQMALGKGLQGGHTVIDLAAMPHLLIAGATGAGKSVAINAMVRCTRSSCCTR